MANKNKTTAIFTTDQKPLLMLFMMFSLGFFVFFIVASMLVTTFTHTHVHTHTNTRTSTNGRSLFFFVFHLQKKLYFIFASSALHQFYVSLILQWVPHNNQRFKKICGSPLLCSCTLHTLISVQCYLYVRWQQRHPCHSPAAAANGYKQKANL